MSVTITSYNGELCHITDDIANDVTSSYDRVKTRCKRYLSNYTLGGYGSEYYCRKCGDENDFQEVHKHRKDALVKKEEKHEEENKKRKKVFQERKAKYQVLIRNISHLLRDFGMIVQTEHHPNGAIIECEIDGFRFRMRGIIE